MSPENDFQEYRDEFGQTAPLLVTDGQRTPPPEGFFTGPAIGSPFPDFKLRSASGEMMALHANRGNSKAAVVFFRSAVW